MCIHIHTYVHLLSIPVYSMPYIHVCVWTFVHIHCWTSLCVHNCLFRSPLPVDHHSWAAAMWPIFSSKLTRRLHTCRNLCHCRLNIDTIDTVQLIVLNPWNIHCKSRCILHSQPPHVEPIHLCQWFPNVSHWNNSTSSCHLRAFPSNCSWPWTIQREKIALATFGLGNWGNGKVQTVEV